MRILVLCGNDAGSVAVANTYAERFSGHDIKFVQERAVSPGRFWKVSLRRLAKQGLWSLLGVYGFYLYKMARGEKPSPRQYQVEFATDEFSRDLRLARLIEEFDPHVVLVGFCGLLSKDFLARLPCPAYNTHPGINPRYRGFGNVWAFYEKNFCETGYTVHMVDCGADTGQILIAEPVDFAGVDFAGIDSHAAVLAAQSLCGFLLGEREGGIAPRFRHLPSKFYGIPTLRQYWAARRNFKRFYECDGECIAK